MKTTTQQFRTTNVKFIKEWTPEQFKQMNNAIARHFSQRKILIYDTGNERKAIRLYNSFNQVDNILGLAYTSSGIWACYGVCNVSAWFDQDQIYQYSYFTIGNNGNFYAVLQDKDENELTILL